MKVLGSLGTPIWSMFVSRKRFPHVDLSAMIPERCNIIFENVSCSCLEKINFKLGKKHRLQRHSSFNLYCFSFWLLLWGFWKTWQILKILNNWVEEIWMDEMKLIKLLISILKQLPSITTFLVRHPSCIFLLASIKLNHHVETFQDFAFAAFSASFLANLNRWCCQGRVLWVTSNTNLGVSNLRKTHVFFYWWKQVWCVSRFIQSRCFVCFYLVNSLLFFLVNFP